MAILRMLLFLLLMSAEWTVRKFEKAIEVSKIKLTLRQQLVLSYVIVVLVPVLLVGLTLTNGMRKLAWEQTVQEAAESVWRVKRQVTDAMRAAIAISNRFFIDRDLESILDRNYESTWEVVSAYRGYLEFDLYPETSSEIAMIRAYSENPTILENWRIMRVSEGVQAADWYQEAIFKKGKISWRFITFPEMKKSFYTLTRVVSGINPVGVLTISLNPVFLNHILLQESFETLLIDENGVIISASDQGLVGQEADKTIFEPILAERNGPNRVYYRDTWYEVISDTVSLEDTHARLHVVSLFPVTEIMSSANRASRLGLMIIAISLAVSLLLIFVLSRLLTERIRLLSERTHRVAAGDLDCSLLVDGEDEIGKLSQDLNEMVQSIRTLYSQKEQLEIKQRDIRFNMLANQINPHFLFNVLETIRMKAVSRGETEIAGVVQRLGKLFRRNLELGQAPIPLMVELDTVISYLEIQSFRFGDRLSYSLDISEEVQDCLILPLIIQPLVENAVIHGMRDKLENGLVTIRAYVDENNLRIAVDDNGIGMDSQQLQRVRDSLVNPPNGDDRIGLRNVYERIRLYYGSDADLTINSTLSKGTTVEIIIPWSGV